MAEDLTGIAAVLGPKGVDVTSALDSILDAMEARGSIKQSTTIKTRSATIAIGSCSHQGEESGANPVERTSLVVDGSIPSSLRLEESEGPAGHDPLSEVIRGSGPLSCLAVSEGQLLAGRDVLGQKPLYSCKNRRGVVAFASLRNALVKIGDSKPEPMTPGLLIVASKRKESVISDRTLSPPREIKVSEPEATRRLTDLLVESLADDQPENSALAFSGGLDSTLVARAAIENGFRPQLITVGLKDQPELNHAQQVSRHLGLDLTLRELSKDDVLSSLADVVEMVESNDPTIVGVSMPLFFACEMAQETGVKCLLAGQLSDELFAGYGRFDRLAAPSTRRTARNEIWRSVMAASTNDFEPGDKVAVSHGMEMRCPFAYLPLVEYALQLPVSLKLKAIEGKIIRKLILRQIAANWKLPDNVVNRPKKAVQYSSGVQKILLKEAKRRGTNLTDLLRSVC